MSLLRQHLTTMASVQEGYDDERFENPVPQNLHCAICLNVLKQPMQCLKNEHSFCKPCINRHLQVTQKCPVCIEPLTQQTLRPSRLAADLLSELKISCENSSRGCREFVKLEVLEVHVGNCDFNPVQCSNEGCELIVNRKDQLDHEMNECDFRLGECRICGERVSYWERNLHCYVTRNEMDEVKRSLKETKDETSSIKEMMMNMSRQLTRKMDDVMKQMGDLKCQVTAGKSDFPSTIKKLENEDRFPGLTASCLQANVSVRENIIIAGGYNQQSVEMFSWTTRQWTHLPPMTSVRVRSSSFVHEDQMFVCGGEWCEESIEVLNLKEPGAQWKKFTAKLPQRTYGHTTVVYENNLFIFGGKSGDKIVNDIYKVSLVPPYSSQLVCHLSEPRTWHGAQCFGDKVVIVGGTTAFGSSGFLDTVLLYDITNNCCQTLAPLPFAVCNMATVAWKDNIIIIGGWDKNNKTLNTVVVYNITNGKSTMLPPMKHERANCSAVITGNVIVVMAGKGERGGALNSVECFNIHTYTWEELPTMKEKRWWATAVVKSIS